MVSVAQQRQQQQQQNPHPPLPSIEWTLCTELGYVNETPTQEAVCFWCGNAEKALSKCAKCRVASYCSRECQIKDWKAGHKHSCKSKQSKFDNNYVNKGLAKTHKSHTTFLCPLLSLSFLSVFIECI